MIGVAMAFCRAVPRALGGLTAAAAVVACGCGPAPPSLGAGAALLAAQIATPKPSPSPRSKVPAVRATPAPVDPPHPSGDQPANGGPAPAARPVAPAAAEAARLGGLLAEGEAALGHQRWEQAERLFDQALALDPGNARAKAGRDQARGFLLGGQRSFVNDLPNAESENAPGKPEGFDDVEELDVKKAAQIPGRAEIEVSPGRVTPGDPYTVKLFLRNTSRKKRTIKIREVNLTRSVNGQTTPVTAVPAVTEVKRRERALLAALSGAWEAGIEDWQLEVRVISVRGDVYQNRVVWK
jgi:hypothetical protein